MRTISLLAAARTLSLACLAGLLLSSCVTPEQRRAQASDHYKLGVVLLEAAGPATAGEAELNKAILADPQFAPPHNALAQLWARSGKHTRDEMVAEYETAVRLDPNLAEGHLNLGKVFLHEPANILKSVEHLRAAVRLAPKSADAWGSLAEALRAAQDWTGAVAACREAVALDAKNSYAWFRLASTLNDRPGHEAEAIYLYEYALGVDPNSSISHTNLALLLMNDPRRGSEALSHMQAVMRLEQPQSMNWSNLGRVQLQTGDPAAALESVNKALEMDPKNFIAYRVRGDVHGTRREFDAALSDFEKVVEFQPEDAEVRMQIGRVRGEQGDYDAAIADLTRAIDLAPQFVPAYGFRAIARQQKGDMAGALADVSQGIELDPGSVWLWGMRGSLKRMMGTPREGLPDLNQVILLQPAYFWAWLNRAESHRLLGDYAGALADVAEGMRLQPENSALYEIRGRIKIDQGDFAAATSDMDHAVQLEPNNPAPYQGRGMLHYRTGDFSSALLDYTAAMGRDEFRRKAYSGFWCSLLRLRLHLPSDPHDLWPGLTQTKEVWARQVALFLNGDIDEAAFFAAAKIGEPQMTDGRLCEAYYYAGMMSLLGKQEPVRARQLFEQCVATNVIVFTEYRFAKIELGRGAQ